MAGKVLCERHIDFDKREHANISEMLGEFSEDELEKLIRYETLMREMFTNHP